MVLNTVSGRRVCNTLINFLCGSAKLAIWLTRKNQIQGAGCVLPVSVVEGLVKARLRVEHWYYRTTDNVVEFNIWSVVL